MVTSLDPLDDFHHSTPDLDPLVHVGSVEHKNRHSRVLTDVADLLPFSLRVHEKMLAIVIDPHDIGLRHPTREERGEHGMIRASGEATGLL